MYIYLSEKINTQQKYKDCAEGKNNTINVGLKQFLIRANRMKCLTFNTNYQEKCLPTFLKIISNFLNYYDSTFSKINYIFIVLKFLLFDLRHINLHVFVFIY